VQRKLKRLHFVGIGGIGMAALAELLHARGYTVTGSDLSSSPMTEHLETLGLAIHRGHDAALVGDAEAVVRSSAIPHDNVELAAAHSAGIPIIDRGALLADVMRTQDGVAIGGSHGKTTTTALTTHLLDIAGLDPTALIGGRIPHPGGTASPTRLGASNLLVAEVDESDGSFLLTRPVVAVVTNADPEHLDHYGTRESLLDAFVDFANSVPFWGAAILGIDHPGVAEIAPRIRARQVRFGFGPEADLRAESVTAVAGGQRCIARLRGDERLEFSLPMPGAHNVLNALAAIAVGLEFDVPLPLLLDGVSSFRGVARRFERKGEVAGVEFVDDYAHHPAEISATLRAARGIHPGRVVAIFQPHRYTRTRDCWADFLDCFRDADRVVLCDIYAASESPIAGVDSEALARAIGGAGHPDARYGGSLDDIAADAGRLLEGGDLVLTLGAGDIVGLTPRLIERVRSQHDSQHDSREGGHA
jgi:UDP-N-acetylmuramate--alanine ligase